MTEDAKKAYREYKRQWRRRNQDKVRNSNTRYWERRAEKLRQQAAQQAADNQKGGCSDE